MSRGDFYIDRQLGIKTCGIEEWEDTAGAYNRFESTPYRALNELFKHYQPPAGSRLIDYGCGLGRINFYFFDQLKIGGYGIEVHRDRLSRAQENLWRYSQKCLGGSLPDIRFIGEAAETHLPAPDSNLFYFFNPFSHEIFEMVLENIIESLMRRDRPADLILYYPYDDFMQSVYEEPAFEPHLLINLPWSFDKRELFAIYRHESG